MPYYRINTANLSPLELWRLYPGGAFFSALFAKLRKQAVDTGFRLGTMEGIQKFPEQELPVEFQMQLQRSLKAALREGYESEFFYRIPLQGSSQSISVATIKGRREGFLEIRATVTGKAPARVERERVFRFLAPSGDGKMVVITTSESPSFDPPEDFSVRYHPKLPLAQLVAEHQKHLKEVGISPARVPPDGLADMVVHLHNLEIKRLAERGALQQI
ncbi:MAG: hypothetical protein KC910_29570 [Candidatus Eremiobacteraeota bacterium]|nr:hypothetical protein [Candidatus Eremiobacteraeota bacterium]